MVELNLTMEQSPNIQLGTEAPEYAPLTHYHTSLGSSNAVLSVDTSLYSVQEGVVTQATGAQSHAEGASTRATGGQSHSEGASTQATGAQSHAEGVTTKATGAQAHSEGNFTEASGDQSHSEGNTTIASATCAHAEGYNTLASSPYQHVQGKLNEEDKEGKYAHIVGGGGRGMYWRHNIHTLDWDGNAWFDGGITFHDSEGNEHSLDEILTRLAALEG